MLILGGKCQKKALSASDKHKTTVNHHVSLLVFGGAMPASVGPLRGPSGWMDVLNPHATHPFGVRAVRLTHFVPFVDVLAYGQPDSQRPLGTSWLTASQSRNGLWRCLLPTASQPRNGLWGRPGLRPASPYSTFKNPSKKGAAQLCIMHYELCIE